MGGDLNGSAGRHGRELQHRALGLGARRQAIEIEGEAPHARKYYSLTRAGAKRLSTMKAEWRAFAEKIERLMASSERNAS